MTPGLRPLVNKNSIITGGSIVSMLLGEEVHDYDYYFTSYETALAVTQYYVKKFNDAHPKKTIEVKTENGRIRVWIQSAGVAAGVSPEDESAEQPKSWSLNRTDQVEKPKYRPVYLTSNAITLSDKVQLVIRFYGDAAEIHSNYDFIHCTCYWERGPVSSSPRSRRCRRFLAKELVYQGSKYPLASVIPHPQIYSARVDGQRWAISQDVYADRRHRPQEPHCPGGSTGGGRHGLFF